MTLEGLSGSLLERKGLENFTPIRPAAPARLIGRAVCTENPAPAIYTLPKDTIVIRPATATQSAIEFQLEAVSVIPLAGGLESANLVSAVCTTYGTNGNGVPVSPSPPVLPAPTGLLELKYPINGIIGFQVTSESAGGAAKQSDPDYRRDIREAARGRHEATYAGITRLLKTVKLETGHRVTTSKLFENFTTSRVMAIIDDGSGDSSIVAPVDTTTYDVAGFSAISPLLDATYWEHLEHGMAIDLQLPQYHIPSWADWVNAGIRFYDASTATWSVWAANTDYFVDVDSGKLVFATPINAGDRVRVWFTFYTGLVGLAAKYMNGIVGDPSLTGWEPVGQQIRIRGPYTVTNPTAGATVVFNPGFDSQFGRELIETYVVTYLNSLDIGEAAKIGVINHIANSVPGVKSVDDLLLNGGSTDVQPTHQYGVVRGNGVMSF